MWDQVRQKPWSTLFSWWLLEWVQVEKYLSFLRVLDTRNLMMLQWIYKSHKMDLFVCFGEGRSWGKGEGTDFGRLGGEAELEHMIWDSQIISKKEKGKERNYPSPPHDFLSSLSIFITIQINAQMNRNRTGIFSFCLHTFPIFFWTLSSFLLETRDLNYKQLASNLSCDFNACVPPFFKKCCISLT